MDILEKKELIGSPPKICINKDDQIHNLNSKFDILEENFKKLKLKISTIKNNKINIDIYSKLNMLSKSFNEINNDIDDLTLSFDIEKEWTLRENDIEKINCNNETNDIFRTFLPYMLMYKLMKDTNQQ